MTPCCPGAAGAGVVREGRKEESERDGRPEARRESGRALLARGERAIVEEREGVGRTAGVRSDAVRRGKQRGVRILVGGRAGRLLCCSVYWSVVQ